MFKRNSLFPRHAVIALALILGLAITTSSATTLAGSDGDSFVIPPQARPYGSTYAQWSAKWEQWLLALPVAGNPQLGCPVPPDAGQTGPIWFITPQIGAPASCSIQVPAGKSVFVPLLAVYFDSLSGFNTAEEQRDLAQFFANHIIPSSLFCEIDGRPVSRLTKYRFLSPQFEFTAPSPWIGGDVGGTGTATADGYYVILHPLPVGTHTIRFGGAVHLSVAEGDPFDADFAVDTTYHLAIGR